MLFCIFFLIILLISADLLRLFQIMFSHSHAFKIQVRKKKVSGDVNLGELIVHEQFCMLLADYTKYKRLNLILLLAYHVELGDIL